MAGLAWPRWLTAIRATRGRGKRQYLENSTHCLPARQTVKRARQEALVVANSPNGQHVGCGSAGGEDVCNRQDGR
jgi:hypothetical protein